jgi:hypothetical protein
METTPGRTISCGRCGKPAAKTSYRFCTACGMLLDRASIGGRRQVARAVVALATLALALLALALALGPAALGGR